MPTLEFIFRLLAAMAAGGVVGLERQINNKSAGFRTNTLVSVGASIYVLINVMLTENGGDPTRIIGQIVTGIGFLGAGVILHRGINVQGLTTAATIWCSAALGSLAGLGLYMELLISTVLIILVNTAFKKADKWFMGERKNKSDKNERPFE
ncbi:MAG: MgtC/SapB family protein [Bacteroidia bacterium]|nr:MgtC/SapB family protein [Bacteroidia bacterium]